MRTAIIVCVENNHTGPQAVLLARSLRRFGGVCSQLPTFAFSPRGLLPKRAVLRQLQQAGVELIDEPSRGVLAAGNGYVNKVIACAWAERRLGMDRLIFVDSDSVFLDDPAALLESQLGVGLTPVWAAGLGSSGRDDPADLIWTTAFGGADLPAATMETRITRQRIRPYFNSGLVVARTELGLFTNWERTFLQLAANRQLDRLLTRSTPPANPYFSPSTFIDQLALAVCVAQLGHPVALLDERYNSPLHYFDSLPMNVRAKGLAGIVHCQHQGYLGWPGLLNALPSVAGEGREYRRWLSAQAAILPPAQPEWPPGFLRRFEDEMRCWRHELSHARELGA
jgi:hypothetical protein